MTDTGLPTRLLGRTGMQVTRLGYGAMSLDPGRLTPVTEEQADTILNAVLDAGINFIDTSPDYGPSEEYIGRFVSHRRAEFFIATKCGCPVSSTSGDHEYTPENITAAVDQSLQRMHTDYLDLVEFHGTPSRRVLEQLGAIETLRDLQRAGKIRFFGASSTLPRLAELLAMDVFDAFQIPYSALQREHEAVITEAARAGAGTVIRGGAVRGAPAPEKAWSVRRLPEVDPARPQAYWERGGLDDLLDGMGRMEFILRFTLSHPDLDTAIVGTANHKHLAANVEAVRKGPLPPDLLAEAKRRLNAIESVSQAG
jgi:aryl-alcohol dehydrogenase-like predicted oxidoreductase